MVKVDLTGLEGDAKDGLVLFVESKLPVKSESQGDIITFEDKSDRTHVSAPEVKTYLKRYIHSKDLRKQFRILSEDGKFSGVLGGRQLFRYPITKSEN